MKEGISMVQFEELRLRLLESEKPLTELASALGLEEMAKEIAVLEEKTTAEDFWGDLANSQKVLQRIAALKNKTKAYEDLKTAYEDALVMIELSDEEGDLVTSIVNGKDCVFTCYGEDGSCYCAIEKAYRAGKCNFYKPVSCHLYPIRVGEYGPYRALNYDRWDVCKMAVLKGQKENLPIYKFLKEPLIRRFGEDWYAELELVAEELASQGII